MRGAGELHRAVLTVLSSRLASRRFVGQGRHRERADVADGGRLRRRLHGLIGSSNALVPGRNCAKRASHDMTGHRGAFLNLTPPVSTALRYSSSREMPNERSIFIPHGQCHRERRCRRDTARVRQDCLEVGIDASAQW